MTMISSENLASRIRTKSSRNAIKIVEILMKAATPNENTAARGLWLAEKVFWVIVYLLGVIITILTCIDLYQDYRDHPYSIRSKPMEFDQSDLPNVTVCLPFIKGKQIADFWTKYNYLSVANKLEPYFTACQEQEPQQISLAQKIDQVFSKMETWKAAQEAAWEPPLLYVSQQYLAAIYEAELLLASNGEYSIASILQGKATDNDTISQAIVNSLIPQMSKWNATIRELEETFGQKFCEFFQVNMTLVSGYTTTKEDLVDNFCRNVDFITKDQVCYKIRLSDFALNEKDSIRIFVDKKKACYEVNCGMRDSNLSMLEAVGDFGAVTVDFNRKRRTEGTQIPYDKVFRAEFEEYTLLSVKPMEKYVYEPEFKGKAVCLIDETIDECKAKCCNTAIRKQCSCLPVTIAIESDFEEVGQRNCMFGEYEHCLLKYISNTSALNEGSGCISSCLDSCVQRQYNISTTPYSLSYLPFWYQYWHEYGEGDDIVMLDIKTSNSSYLSFSEFSPFTIESTIGNIGGALGFWLGLDIFTILYISLTVPVLFLIKKVFRKESAEASMKVTDASVAVEGARSDNYHWLISAVMDELKLQYYELKAMNFVERVKWTFQKLTWSLLFLIGIGLTLKLYIQLCYDYKSANTQSVITIMDNQSIFLPPSALCIPAIPDIYFDVFLSLEYPTSQDIQELVKDVDFNLTYYLRSDEPWPSVLNFLVFSYYKYIIIISQISDYNTDKKQYAELRPLNFLFNITQGLLVKYSVQFNELYNRAAQEFAVHTNVTANCYRSSTNETVTMLAKQVTTEIAPLIETYRASLCLHFPLETFDFRDDDDRCSIFIINKQYIHYVYGGLPIYWTFKSPTSLDYDPTIFFSKRGRLEILFIYSAKYQYETNCVQDIYPADCFTKCFLESYLDTSINCIRSFEDGIGSEHSVSLYGPEEYYPPTPDWGYCLYSDVLQNYATCRDNCKKAACTQYSYALDFEDIPEMHKYDYGPDEYYKEINIRIRNVHYVLMSESLLMSRADYLAASGGLLGFYLGLDVTFLISIILTPLLFLYGMWLRRSPSNAVSGNIFAPANTTISAGKVYLRYLAYFFKVKTKSTEKFPMDKLIERLLWSVIYFFLGAMTFIMCVDFFRLFRDSPIASSVNINRAKELNIPFTFCIPLTASELEESQYNETSLSKRDYNYLLNTSFKRQQLSDTAKWSTALLQIAHRYLTIVEQYKIMEQTDSTIFNQILNNQASYAAMELFGSQLEQQNISQYELLQKFGKELQRSYLIDITKQWKNSTDARVIRLLLNQTHFISESMICYILPADAISFTPEWNKLTLNIDKSQLVNASCPESPYIYSSSHYFSPISLVQQEVQFDILDSEADSLYFKNSLRSFLGQKKTIDVKVGDIIQMLPKIRGESRCSETVTQVECQDRCRRMAIEQQCNCSLLEPGMKYPSTLSNSNRMGCTWTFYKSCLPHFSTESASECIKKCPISCKRVRYEVDIASVDTYENNCGGSYTVQTSTYFYQIYEERPGWTFFSFAAQLGGVLGLFVGIDITMIAEWIFAIASWISRRCRKTAAAPEKKSPPKSTKHVKTKILRSSEKPNNTSLTTVEIH